MGRRGQAAEADTATKPRHDHGDAGAGDGPRGRQVKPLRLWLLEQWLLWRYTGGDRTVERRLLAVYKLRRMHRIREIREMLDLGEELGVREQVAEAIRAHLLAELDAWLEELGVERHEPMLLVLRGGRA